ncbi:hypothetical protein TNCV_3970531 [Trichonephila clavipes]|nr:hypothetical protein TNCV_3970531 [Trichonephila clavipes]
MRHRDSTPIVLPFLSGYLGLQLNRIMANHPPHVFLVLILVFLQNFHGRGNHRSLPNTARLDSDQRMFRPSLDTAHLARQLEPIWRRSTKLTSQCPAQ